ncbi:hypothetical protein ACFQZC_02200 [Streptacidiphilus monticola]
MSAASGTGHAVGDVVLARTSLGPLGFDDPMEIVALTPRPAATACADWRSGAGPSGAGPS